MILLGENNGGWWGKKKSTTPSLTFPFALFLNKIGNLAEKTDKYGFHEVSQALHDSFLSSVDFYDM